MQNNDDQLQTNCWNHYIAIPTMRTHNQRQTQSHTSAPENFQNTVANKIVEMKSNATIATTNQDELPKSIQVFDCNCAAIRQKPSRTRNPIELLHVARAAPKQKRRAGRKFQQWSNKCAATLLVAARRRGDDADMVFGTNTNLWMDAQTNLSRNSRKHSLVGDDMKTEN